MQVTFIHSIHQIDPQQWDALWASDYPFTRHAFFAALEDSLSTRAETGWQPSHALIKVDGRLIGVVPLFIKSHSYGEYVFDWAWADAYRQHQLPYYPKLVNAIPFTPSTGPRIALSRALSRMEQDRAMHRLHECLGQLLEEQGGSGWHSLFPDADSQSRLAGLPLVTRYGYQFHWFNQGYATFEDFLSTFISRKRKSVNRERAKVQDAGLRMQRRLGDEVSSAEWQAFYDLYQRTYLKRSGHYGYLGPSFFERLAQAMPEQLLLVSAHHQNGPMVAGALFLQDGVSLYGRYWGALEDYDGLHFEACYYQGIEHAIGNGLARFDPGAQGEHKIQRGFTPIKTRSSHWLADARFAHAVEGYCRREAREVDLYIADARSYLPFRRYLPVASADILMPAGPADAGAVVIDQPS